ncbi:PPA5 phosphatase, partial [Vireo altiloquus]|nr:PPA5 phosphatase [Vireo altiloquus]
SPQMLALLLLWLTLGTAVTAGGGRGGALSFLALGDWGGLPDPPFVTPRQVATAAAMGQAATELGGDFVLALGDNFYYEGVRDEWDPRFQDTFERVFVSPGLRGVPWYVLAGNHDHAGNVTAQLRYSHHSPRWYGPSVPKCPQMSPSVPKCPQEVPKSPQGVLACPRVPQALSPPRACCWAVPTLSPSPPRGVPKAPRECPQHGPTPCLLRLLRPLLRRHRVTAYLCGHDHNLQYLEEGGVGYVLSGAGNFMEDSRPHEGSVPPGSLRFFYGTPTSPGGFAHLRLEPGAVTVTFLEATGRVLHRVTLPPRHP